MRYGEMQGWGTVAIFPYMRACGSQRRIELSEESARFLWVAMPRPRYFGNDPFWRESGSGGKDALNWG